MIYAFLRGVLAAAVLLGGLYLCVRFGAPD